MRASSSSSLSVEEDDDEDGDDDATQLICRGCSDDEISIFPVCVAVADWRCIGVASFSSSASIRLARAASTSSSQRRAHENEVSALPVSGFERPRAEATATALGT
jgi:hypothetical protein